MVQTKIREVTVNFTVSNAKLTRRGGSREDNVCLSDASNTFLEERSWPRLNEIASKFNI